MNDLNFFESYIEESEFTIDKKIILYILVLGLSLFFIIFTLSNQLKIKKLSRDVKKLQIVAEDERVNKKIEEIKEKEEEVIKFNESLEKIRILDKNIEEASVIDSYLLNNINHKIPNEVFFTSISMYTDNIQIIGYSKDKWAIAQLGKNLETIEDFHEIFISNISSEELYYNFVLNISLKDVNEDEQDPIEGEESPDEEPEPEEADEE